MQTTKTRSIMIIDDDEIQIFLTKKSIQSLNIPLKIESFSNAAMALRYFSGFKDEQTYRESFVPEIILLDINMPAMDGFQFLDEFYKLTIPNIKPLKICFVSASCNELEIERAKMYGENCSFTSKPINQIFLQKYLNGYI